MILLLLYYCNILKWFTITFHADKIFLIILFIYDKNDYLGALAETINDGSRILVEHTIDRGECSSFFQWRPLYQLAFSIKNVFKNSGSGDFIIWKKVVVSGCTRSDSF